MLRAALTLPDRFIKSASSTIPYRNFKLQETHWNLNATLGT
jgi:hypothetical protein